MAATGRFAGLALAAVVGAGSTQAAAPRQAWMSDGGVIRLGPNNPGLERDDALQRLKIAEALSRWGMANDESRFDVMASLFTRDATLTVLRGGVTPVATAHGRDEIVAIERKLLAQQRQQRRHVVGNVVIEKLGGSTASLLAYAIIVAPGAPGTIDATVVYKADLVREADGAWRFADLVIAMDT